MLYIFDLLECVRGPDGGRWLPTALKTQRRGKLSTVFLVLRWPVSFSPLDNRLGLLSPTRIPAFFLCV